MSKYFRKYLLRNQIEQSLWKYFATVKDWGNDSKLEEMPKVFQSRIKKLLNLDRANGKEKNNWAFYDSAASGTGSQESFSEFHNFMMAIGLQMLNIGFKQSEIVFFLQHSQDLVKPHYIELRSSGKVAPIFGTKRNIVENSISLYMLVTRAEMKEIILISSSKDPQFFEPIFAWEIDGLQKELHTHTNDYVAFVVIELADMAITLPELTKDILPATRGRPG